MASAHNGAPGRSPTVRYRFDGRAGALPGGHLPEQHHSGRRLVVVAVLSVLLTWAGLYVLFRVWRAGYRERAALGARIVGPAIDPLTRVVPPDVDPAQWVRAVAQTHAMLDRLTASGVLNRPQMEELQRDLAARVGRATPQTATLELIHVWANVHGRAGPVLSDVPYPALLELSSRLDPLERVVPPRVDANSWARALDQTRLMLVAVTISGRLDDDQTRELRQKVTRRIRQARPATLPAALGRIWDDASALAPEVVGRLSRPQVTAPTD